MALIDISYVKLRPELLPIDANLMQCYTMDIVHHFIEFGELKQVYMLINHKNDTCSEFQWAFTLSSEGDESDISYLIEMTVLLEMPT